MDTAQYVAELSRLLREELDLDAIAALARELDAARTNWRVVYVAGNGGSAATAGHIVNDLMKAASSNEKYHPFRVVSLADNAPLLTAWSNDDLYTEALADMLKSGLRGDVLLAISTSGASANILNAAREARERGMVVLALTGCAPNALTELADGVVSVSTPHPGLCEDVHLAVNHMLVELLRE